MPESIPISPATPWWFIILVFTPLVLLALVKWLDPVFIPGNWRALAGGDVQRDQAGIQRWGSVVMGIALLVSLLALVTKSVEVVQGLGTPWEFKDVFIILGAVLGYQLLRFLTLGLVSVVTGGSRYVLRYFEITYRLSILAGMITSILLLLSFTMSDQVQLWVVYLCVLVFVLAYLWGFLTALSAALSAGLRPHYIILYLCTLEILPLVVIFWRLDEVLGWGIG